VGKKGYQESEQQVKSKNKRSSAKIAYFPDTTRAAQKTTPPNYSLPWERLYRVVI
jgi:hypothetical protein